MTHVGTNSYFYRLYHFITGKKSKKAIEQLDIHKTVIQISLLHSFIFGNCFMHGGSGACPGNAECEAGILDEMPVDPKRISVR